MLARTNPPPPHRGPRFGVSYVDKTDAALWRVRHQLFDTRDPDMCLEWVKAINERLDVV